MRAPLFAAAALLSSALVAHADTIQGFNFNSDLTGGYTAQGLINIDTDNGQIVSSNFTLSQNGVIDATFTNPDYSGPYGGVSVGEFQDSTDGYTYELLLPNSTLIDYAGGNVCTVFNTCAGGNPSGVYFPDGTAQGAIDGSLSPTPEPAGLVLMATGLAAGYVASRRRWA